MGIPARSGRPHQRSRRPSIRREKLRQVGGIGGRDLDHVDGAHPRRKQRLMAVSHGCVGQEQLLLRASSRQRPCGPSASSRLRVPCAALLRAGRADAGLSGRQGAWAARCFGMAVDCDVGDICQHFGAAVTALFEGEQIRRLVDELGGVFIVEERRVLEQVFDKGDVGAHAREYGIRAGRGPCGQSPLRAFGRGL